MRVPAVAISYFESATKKESPMIRSRFLVPLVLIVLPVLLQAGEPFRYPEGKYGAGELKHINGIPVLVLSGTPQEVGEQTGTVTKTAITRATTYLNTLLKEFRLEASLPWMVRVANGMTRQFPPDHLAEAEAAIKAGGFDRDLVIVANCLWDIKKLGCSTLYVGSERSATGVPLLGRNFDFPNLGSLYEITLVTVYRINGKRAFASVGFPGLVGCISGLNDAGLAIATLDVDSTADGSISFDLAGTPMALTFRRIMEECATVDEAEKLLRAAKRTTRLNLAVCDKRGGAVFELTPKSVAVRSPEQGLCVCTNHFRTKGMATDLQCRRYDILMKSCELEKLSMQDLAKHLHLANQGDDTIQTMVFEPASLKLHLAFGKGPSTALPLKMLELDTLLVKEKAK